MSRNILLVVRPAAGGIRSHVTALIRHLDRDCFSVGVAAPTQFLNSLPSDLPEFAQFSVPISAKPSAFDLAAALQIAGIAARENYIVHAHGIRAGFVASLAAKMASFPMIVTYHNLPPHGQLSKVALAFINKSSQAIIAVSQAIADQLPIDNLHIIPNGIDLLHFANLKPVQSRTKLGIKNDAFVVGCIARLSPEKGVDILLRAAKLLPDIQFIAAGDGAERDRLTMMAPRNVRLMGYVDDVRDIYASSNVITIPSRFEGQGIVALEAMASGTTIVATRVGGLVETVRDGATGVLVEPDNPTELAEAIENLQNSSFRLSVAEAAKKWVFENCDVKKRVYDVEEVYGSLE